MRVVNEEFKEIKRNDADLSMGVLVPTMIIKGDAVPIDYVNKFAWDDDDWEEAEMYILNFTELQPPTQLDRIESQVVYTAMMTNTLLEEQI